MGSLSRIVAQGRARAMAPNINPHSRAPASRNTHSHVLDLSFCPAGPALARDLQLTCPMLLTHPQAEPRLSGSLYVPLQRQGLQPHPQTEMGGGRRQEEGGAELGRSRRERALLSLQTTLVSLTTHRPPKLSHLRALPVPFLLPGIPFQPQLLDTTEHLHLLSQAGRRPSPAWSSTSPASITPGGGLLCTLFHISQV